MEAAIFFVVLVYGRDFDLDEGVEETMAKIAAQQLADAIAFVVSE